MGNLEDSIITMQEDITTSRKRAVRTFRPGWLLTALVVAVIFGGSTYILTGRVRQVDLNGAAIHQACIVRNEQIQIVNDRFAKLVGIFDISLANRDPSQPPPPAEIAKLYAEFRIPIPLLKCKK